MPPTCPNILLLMVDQMRTPRWFPAGTAFPAYDRLRREGRSFERSYVVANPCSPSRASIMTGLHYTQHGIFGNVDADGIPGIPSLDPRIPTVGHAFQRAGYKTPYVGKWHLTSPADIEGVGLSAYGFEGWDGPDAEGKPLQGLAEDPGFATRAAAWIRDHAHDGPWFLTCSFVNPHDVMFYKRTMPPADCPAVCALPDSIGDDLATKPRIQGRFQRFWGRLMGMTPDQPDELWRRYGDFYLWLTHKVDAEMARVLDALDASGVAGDTLTVFLSDHGEMAGAHKLQGKGPFVYEENVHVPLVFRWPGRIAPGTTSQALTHNVDLFPTLLALAGAGDAPEYLPGRSLAPVVLGDDARAPHEHVVLSWGMTAGRMPAGPFGAAPARATTVPDEMHGLFEGRHKLGRYFAGGLDDEYELYDLREDPLELRNLATDPGYARVTREMINRLRAVEATELAPIAPEWLRLRNTPPASAARRSPSA